jgi:hypothetical protein
MVDSYQLERQHVSPVSIPLPAASPRTVKRAGCLLHLLCHGAGTDRANRSYSPNAKRRLKDVVPPTLSTSPIN